MHNHKTAFVVEHDFIMATYLADRVIVYTGTAGVNCTALAYVLLCTVLLTWLTFSSYRPQSLLTGMNMFLRNISITIRRDPSNFRPRINKPNCVRDREQKKAGTYFYVGDDVIDY